MHVRLPGLRRATTTVIALAAAMVVAMWCAFQAGHG